MLLSYHLFLKREDQQPCQRTDLQPGGPVALTTRQAASGATYTYWMRALCLGRIQWQATLIGLGLGVVFAPPPRVHQLVGRGLCVSSSDAQTRPRPVLPRVAANVQRGRSGGSFCLLDLLLLLLAKLHLTSKRKDFFPKVVLFILVAKTC